jgi:hypothetical protein
MPKLLKPWLLCCLLLGCLTFYSGCGASNRVELKTTPAGAEVFDRGDNKLGVTPLTLEGEPLERASEDKRLFVTVRNPGYESRSLILDYRGGLDTHELTLSKQEDAFFSKTTLNDFAPQVNEMVRQLLGIQGLLVVKKLDQAERELETFQKRYPQVAAGLVMQATVSISRGQSDRALGYLKRARQLDPADPVVTRMLKGLTEQRRH